MSIREAFGQHRSSLAGRIVILGSVGNLALAVLNAWKALDVFPGPAAEGLFAAALLCATAPVLLVAMWVSYGRHVQYRASTLLTLLLVLIATAPTLASLLL